MAGPTIAHASDTIEIPADLIDLHRQWVEADAQVHQRIAEIEQHEAEHGRPPLPTTPDARTTSSPSCHNNPPEAPVS
ncbi:hypothetical protein F4556_006631 [Kitasatospora gansuensis]|uniref:Uncharacterized protein n=1 Tax=Kitasatospora gansuensis TaxID=258050 RepID=A0A7W7SII6_9ACTN|nr:hypothetical protein [Kitasatospora gansuensis]MBB4951096.1 hypothetical protein [Kitasatospora gansuensis]